MKRKALGGRADGISSRDFRLCVNYGWGLRVSTLWGNILSLAGVCDQLAEVDQTSWCGIIDRCICVWGHSGSHTYGLSGRIGERNRIRPSPITFERRRLHTLSELSTRYCEATAIIHSMTIPIVCGKSLQSTYAAFRSLSSPPCFPFQAW